MSSITEHQSSSLPRSQQLFFWLWLRCCKLLVRIFYRKFEITGAESLPQQTGLILCANHVNALADGVILQAAIPRLVRPLARSGLFEMPGLGSILNLIGAVPVYRRQDDASQMTRNDDSFSRCYELLSENQTIAIFPEGQSHSDPHLHELKTGAARIAFGASQRNKEAPVVLPVGLIFVRKGKFRGDVLVNFAAPVDLQTESGIEEHAAVEMVNQRIRAGLESVTLNAESWRDVDLVRRVEQFFAYRHGKYRQRSLGQRFRAQQRLIDAQQLLKRHEPDKVRSLMIHLRAFERLRKCCGVDDYQSTVNYKPALIILYVLRSIFIMVFGLGVALWGWINSFIPYELTRQLVRRTAKGRDQYDTSKMIIAIPLFTLFWGVQCWYVYSRFGVGWSLGYVVSLIVSSLVAIYMQSEWRRILENIRVFILFSRKRKLREYLITKRRELEKEMARLVRIAGRLSLKNQ